MRRVVRGRPPVGMFVVALATALGACAPQPAPVVVLTPAPATQSFVFAPQTAGPASGGATPQSLQVVFPDVAQEVAFTGTGIVQFNTGTVGIGGGDLVAGQVLDFGPVAVPGGPPVLRSFTLRNTGTQVADFVGWNNETGTARSGEGVPGG